MTTTVFPGRYESLSAIRDFVVNVAKGAGFKDFDLYAVELAVDEACSNIIEHAYGGENKGDIELTCEFDRSKSDYCPKRSRQTIRSNNYPRTKFRVEY